MSVITIVITIIFFVLALFSINIKAREESFNIIELSKMFNYTDYVIIGCLTLITAIISLHHLGNNAVVASYNEPGGEYVYFSCPEENVKPASIMLFLGDGEGNHKIEGLTIDGRIDEVETVVHDYGTNFCWKKVSIANPEEYSEYRIKSDGSAYLGEIGLTDTDGNILPIVTSSEILCDEQNAVVDEYNYMNSTYFDEIYYVRSAWELDNGKYPFENTHPPLGKMLTLLGIQIFGLSPFGWRVMGVLFGIMLVPMMYALVKVMFNNTIIATLTALLLSFDFMRFTQSRLSTIDTFSVFFVLLMFLMMYLYLRSEKILYLFLCGIAFGLGISTKWNCFYAGAGLGVIWVIYWIIHYKKGFKEFAKNSGICVIAFILIPAVLYYMSYILYARAEGYLNPLSEGYFKTVTDNISSMYSYHSNLTATHPYSSTWYQWLFNIKPILYYADYFNEGRAIINCFLNPICCWCGFVAIIVTAVCAVVKKDKNALFILIGYFSNLIPWVFVTRCTFEYHYFSSAMFLILAIGYCFNMMIKGKWYKKYYIYVVTFWCIVLFFVFLPVIAGNTMSEEYRNLFVHWMNSWAF